MNILITGIAGLLGSRLADYLLENNNNIKIIGIDDFSGGYIENVNKKVLLYNRHIGKSDIEDIFIENNIDYVFHFAAYAAECLSPFIRKYNYENNLVTTADIVNNCIKYNKNIVFDTNYLLLATIQDSNIITNDNIKTNDIICLYPDKNDVFTLFYTKSQLDMMKRFSPGYDG